MALLDGANGLFGNNNDTEPAYNLQGRIYKESRFMDGDVTVTGNGFEDIGEVRVGANQKIEFGQGNRSLDPLEQGRPFHEYVDSNGNTIDGEVRLLHVSAQSSRVLRIVDYSTQALNEPTKSEREVQPRASKPAQPNRGKPAAGEDDFLRIKLNANVSSNTTVSQSDKAIRQPEPVDEQA